MQATYKINSFCSPIVPSLHNKRSTITCAYNRETNGRDLRLTNIDESMLLLRKRIHDTKLAERNYEAPSDWSEWEKKYYIKYGLDVCELMGFLQAFFINTRPSLGLGLMGLLLISVPMSTVMVFNFMTHAWNLIITIQASFTNKNM
ncbi:hypothetical protein LUZ60_009874 [Juncus effusus]|nr:hypothetical protein LUZ60_009874 [Juncus effusus]